MPTNAALPARGAARLLALVAALLLFRLGAMPLVGPDEPRYARVAVEMHRRGDWVLPPWAVLRHIVNHSTYHRGQVASKLKRFGIEQPATDFIFWMFEQMQKNG